jgi:hypothetical protein
MKPILRHQRQRHRLNMLQKLRQLQRRRRRHRLLHRSYWILIRQQNLAQKFQFRLLVLMYLCRHHRQTLRCLQRYFQPNHLTRHLKP